MSAPCLPEHGPHYARGLCRRCYDHERRQGRHQTYPRTNRRSTVLVTRAERLRAELEAAGPYAPVPATWRGVAQLLGVKYETLDRTLTRARRYAEKEAS